MKPESSSEDLIEEIKPITLTPSMLTRLSISFIIIGCSLSAENWPRFRGPNGTGISDSKIPVKWTDSNTKWKTILPATGHGSPVLWDDSIFLLCADEEKGTRITVGVDGKTGKILWTKKFTATKHKHHKQNSFASSTPTTDSGHVYFSWGTPENLTLVAMTHKGQIAWKKDLNPVEGGHGFGASPIIYKNLLVINNDQDGESSLLALDKSTGKIIWETSRNSKRLTYSTPITYSASDREEELIFTNWTHGITGINPVNGKVNWENSVFNQSSKERAIGSPIIAQDLVIGTCGFVTKLKHIVALRPKGKLMEEAWRIEKSVPHIPTPILIGKNLFLWNDQGIITCVEAATGKVQWSERAVRSGKFFSSPVAANGIIYCIDSNGKMIVMRGDGKFEILAENDLGQRCNATPAIADNAMYIRTYTELIAIAK